MNILAHLHLSGGINEHMLGNYMGDFVKGKSYTNYPLNIQNGILLHREIDTYTDNHASHRKSRDRFREEYGLYSGVVVDIIYDYFLASQWSKFHAEPLVDYSQKVYKFITLRKNELPLRLQEISPFLIKNNWFLKYSSIDGIRQVLTGMSKRTSLPNKVDFAIYILENHYNELNIEFNQTFSDLMEMVEKSSFLPNMMKKHIF